MFLHELAADEIEERLKDVNRTFTNPAVVAGFDTPWSRFGTVHPDTEVLNLDVQRHDLIIHAMCLHWADDPVGQLVQCRRALKPDGLFLAVLLGGQTLVELRAALAQAESEISGGLSPRVAPMGEIRDLGGLLQRAGFALPVADGMTSRVEYQSTRHLMHDLRAMGEGNALAARARKPSPRSLFSRADAIYRAAQATLSGRIGATFDLIYLTGWAPSGDQPKALRPGSAKTRLADALGTTEYSTERSTDD